MLQKLTYSFVILAAVALALIVPAPFVNLGGFEMKRMIVPLLQIIMFGMGTAMSFQDFVGVVKMPKGVLVGLLCQFSLMPFIGFGLATLFGFEPEIAAGIILVGAAPSGLASNVMTYLAKANLALSVTLTAIATFLAPIFTPSYMSWLGGQFIDVDFWEMVLSTVRMVVLPVLGGLLFHQLAYQVKAQSAYRILGAVAILVIGLGGFLWGASQAHPVLQEFWVLSVILMALLAFAWGMRNYAPYLEKAMPLVSMAGIVVIILIITANGQEKLLDIGLLLLLACLIHNLTGYVLGYGICKALRLDLKTRRTISLEVGMQNSGLAAGLSADMGKIASGVGLAAVVFGPVMNITGSILAMWWRGNPIEEAGNTL